jgi:DNA invertase Pin-like site-specific DNA recombinase
MAGFFGYARPTTSLPDPRSHVQQLTDAGAKTIFVEKNSVQARRALRERQRLLEQIAPGDTLILTSLAHLGTSAEDLMRCLDILVGRGIRIKIIDADFVIGGKHAQAYRDLLQLLAAARSTLLGETIRQSLASSRAKGGKASGKPFTLKPEQWPDIKTRIDDATLEQVAVELGVSRQTLWSYRRRMSAQTAASIA